MNCNQLTECIMNYLENDKTNTAIMLSGDWGCGKSYYIKNQLKDELEKAGKGYVLVSLYGINKLEDVSKALYMEAKAGWLTKKSEKGSIAKLTAKTIIKGVASFFGVDLSASQEDLQKIYNSIDFSGKLIVLEDFERCPINKVELLGYINNLVEQDGVKVLVVANEKEIISFKQIVDEESKKSHKEYDESSLRYLRIKEKTIGDTFYFNNDIEETVVSILDLYDSKYLTEIRNQYSQFTKEIVDVMDELKCYNLRSLIYACQKTVDMFRQINWDIDVCFLRNVFLGNIAFCLKKKNKDDVVWNNMDLCSYDLASNKYPIYKFAYYYITFHYLMVDYFKLSEEEFKYFLEKHQADNDLNILHSYYVQTEKDVIDAINRIKVRLETDTTISIKQYPELANYLISVKEVIGCDEIVEQCKSIMIANTQKQYQEGSKFNVYFHNGIKLLKNESVEEFNKFKDALAEPVKEKENPINILNYDVKNIQSFYDNVSADNSFFYKDGFARLLDIEKFGEMLQNCSASDLYKLRQIIGWIYEVSNIKEFMSNDKESILLLIDKTKNIIENNDKIDKIQKQQLLWFANDLMGVSEKL